jgi:hypothetical protein
MKFLSGLIYGLVQLISALIMFVGLFFAYRAVLIPFQSGFRPQTAQVYAELTYYGVIAGVAFLLAILLQLAVTSRSKATLDRIARATAETVYLLRGNRARPTE